MQIWTPRTQLPTSTVRIHVDSADARWRHGNQPRYLQVGSVGSRTAMKVSNATPANHVWSSQDRGQAGAPGAPTSHLVQSMGMSSAAVHQLKYHGLACPHHCYLSFYLPEQSNAKGYSVQNLAILCRSILLIEISSRRLDDLAVSARVQGSPCDAPFGS